MDRSTATSSSPPSSSAPAAGTRSLFTGKDLRQLGSGNVGANETGHVIDLYIVPCPSGEVSVYVDMYGCPEMQQRLDAMTGGV